MIVDYCHKTPSPLRLRYTLAHSVRNYAGVTGDRYWGGTSGSYVHVRLGDMCWDAIDLWEHALWGLTDVRAR